MDDGFWGGKAGPNAANATTVDFEVEFTNPTPVTKHATFSILRGYSDAHVAAELAREWNAKFPLPEGPLAVVAGPRVTFQGNVTAMAFTLVNPPGARTTVPPGGTAVEVVDGLVVFRR